MTFNVHRDEIGRKDVSSDVRDTKGKGVDASQRATRDYSFTAAENRHADVSGWL